MKDIPVKSSIIILGIITFSLIVIPSFAYA